MRRSSRAASAVWRASTRSGWWSSSPEATMGPVRPHRALATSCVTGSGHLAALGSRQGPGGGWVPGVEEKRLFLLPGLVGRSFHASGTFARAGLPDHEKLSMPALSPTMSQGNIVAWKKKEGDAVQPGDVYCEVETDKATIEWEAQEEGYLAKILMGDGTQGIDVGVPVAVLVEEEGDVAAFAGYTGDAADVAAPDGAGSVSGSDAGSGEGSEASPSSSSVFPVHEVMTMPALSPTMAEGTLVAWKKAVGDVISAGDVLAEIETDKATMEWEAQEDGVLAQILVAEGTAGVRVGAPVFVQVEDAAEVASFASFTIANASVDGSEGVDTPAVATTPGSVPSAPKTAAPAVARVSPTPASVPASSAPDGARVIASPYARKLAAANGVSLHALQGSGPNGRIVAADVLGAPASAAAATASAMSPFSDIENSNIRKIIAQRLLESKQQIPHYYLSTTCRVDTVTALRAKLNASLADGKLSMNDFIIKASAMALKKVPEANASWHGDFIRQYNTVHCSIAVQTAAGLMVPVVRNAEKKGLAAISSSVKELAAKAREGRLDPADSADGTFTISNLGMFGVSQFAAIVNPPQACILAVGAAEKKVVPSSEEPGSFEEGTFVTVTLSCDHRVIDGAVGATWLQVFKGYLEDPASMLL